MGAATKNKQAKGKKSIILANLAKYNFDTVVVLPVYSGVLVACRAKGTKLSSAQ